MQLIKTLKLVPTSRQLRKYSGGCGGEAHVLVELVKVCRAEFVSEPLSRGDAARD
eukprot:SAG11_NODE_23948_length_380_cov_1.288256_2_plen_54_part_01